MIYNNNKKCLKIINLFNNNEKIIIFILIYKITIIYAILIN